MTKHNPQSANNTIYFKAFNEDYQIGGVYHKLDNSELRIMIILQSYADCNGYVKQEDDRGYDINTLTRMFGVNYRTTKRCLLSLESQKLIEIFLEDIIYIVGFVDNQTHRINGRKSDYTKTLAFKLNNTLSRLDKAGITNTVTGETT